MPYDLYNINDKIIIRSDQKVGFLSKSPQHELEVSGSTWAKNVTGNIFSGASGYFDSLFVAESIETNNLKITSGSYNKFYLNDINLFFDNVTGDAFYFSGLDSKNIYFDNLNSNYSNAFDLYLKNFTGKVLEINGIKFTDKKNKILSKDYFFPFELSGTLDNFGGPSFIDWKILNTSSGSSLAGFINVSGISGIRNTTNNEALNGESFQTSEYIDVTIKVDYLNNFTGIPNSFLGPKKPTVLMSPGDKIAGQILDRMSLIPNETFFELKFKNISETGIVFLDDQNNPTKVRFQTEKMGKWYYIIIG